MKKVLIIVGVIAVLIMLVVGGAIFWASRNLESMRGDLIKESKEFSDRASNLDECLKNSLAKIPGDGMIVRAKNKVILGNCLEAKKFDPEFCKSVPEDPGIVDRVGWATRKCVLNNTPSGYHPQYVIAKGIVTFFEYLSMLYLQILVQNI